jgi:hypothetical protein
MVLVVCALFGWAALSTAVATERRVPAEYATIQEAIDACVDGDVVSIADGVYAGAGNVFLRFDGRAITVRSENGPENCIIDCEHTTPFGFYFGSGEGPDSVVEGLTIMRSCFD